MISMLIFCSINTPVYCTLSFCFLTISEIRYTHITAAPDPLLVTHFLTQFTVSSCHSVQTDRLISVLFWSKLIKNGEFRDYQFWLTKKTALFVDAAHLRQSCMSILIGGVLANQHSVLEGRNTVAVSQVRGSILRSAHVKCSYITTLCKACPNSKCSPNSPHKCLLLLPFPGGHTATILRSYKLPKIHCAPK